MANEIIKTIKATLSGETMRKNLMNVLPKHISAERMIQISITAITKQPALLQCDPATIYKCVMDAAQLGLVTDGVLGEAYLIPYNSKKGKVCQMIPGYRGMMKLAVRSGKVSHIYAENVYDNDQFNIERGLDPKLQHIPTIKGERGEYIGSYAVAFLVDKDQPPAWEFMRADEVDAIRQRSKAKDNGPWVTDIGEMRKKTAVRRLCKFLPMSPEAQDAAVRGEYADMGALESAVRQGLTPGTSSWGFDKSKDQAQHAKPVEVEVSDVPPETVDQETGEVLDAPEPDKKEALLITYKEMCEAMGVKPSKIVHAMGIERLQQEIEKLSQKG
jgi:recombination protein RecT